MGIFDDIGKTLSDAGHGAVQKGREMADIAKCNSMISDEEKKIQDLYYQIGRQYVAMFGENPDETFAEQIAEIKTSSATIEELKIRILDLKGIMKCPNCGTEIPNTSIFCATCGTKINRPEPEPVQVRYCAGCGSQISPGSLFCTSCGLAVMPDDDETEETAEPAASTIEAAPSVEEAPTIEVASSVEEAPADATPVE